MGFFFYFEYFYALRVIFFTFRVFEKNAALNFQKRVHQEKKREKSFFFSLVFWKHVSAVLALLTFLFLDIFLYIFVQSSVFSFQFLSILKKTLFQSYQRKKKGWNTLKTIIKIGCYTVAKNRPQKVS